MQIFYPLDYTDARVMIFTLRTLSRLSVVLAGVALWLGLGLAALAWPVLAVLFWLA